jgi:hypothetical protein
MEAREPTEKLYQVDFIGRRPLHSGSFGHFGLFPTDVVVDRMISIKQVQAPPPQPTKAEMVKYWKACEAANTCRPNWSEINKMQE